MSHSPRKQHTLIPTELQCLLELQSTVGEASLQVLVVTVSTVTCLMSNSSEETGLKTFLLSSSAALSLSSAKHYRSPIMRFGVELLVVVLAAFQCIGFLVTYILAVHYDHVTPELPYISDTGGKPPESCIFTFVCTVSAILTLLIMYIRYVHIKEYYQMSLPKIKCFNFFAFVIGILSVTGLLLVGAFQDDEVAVVHMIGASMVFGFGILYMWLQTSVSYRVYHASLTRHVTSIVIIVRFVLCILAAVFFVIVMVAMFIAGHQRRHKEGGTYNPFIWGCRDAGYPLHLTSTISEWCLGLSFLLFFLTFHTDFSRISLIISVSLRHEYMAINENTPLNV